MRKAGYLPVAYLDGITQEREAPAVWEHSGTSSASTEHDTYPTHTQNTEVHAHTPYTHTNTCMYTHIGMPGVLAIIEHHCIQLLFGQ